MRHGIPIKALHLLKTKESTLFCLRVSHPCLTSSPQAKIIIIDGDAKQAESFQADGTVVMWVSVFCCLAGAHIGKLAPPEECTIKQHNEQGE